MYICNEQKLKTMNTNTNYPQKGENVLEWFKKQTPKNRESFINWSIVIDNEIFEYLLNHHTNMLKDIIDSEIHISKNNLEILRNNTELFDYCIETKYNMVKDIESWLILRDFSTLHFLKEYEKRGFLENDRTYTMNYSDKLFKLLLNPERKDINLLDIDIIVACRKNLINVLQAHIDNGVDINGDYDDENCLQVACEFGHIEAIKFLCENGADVNYGDGSCINFILSECFDESEKKMLTDLFLSDYSKIEKGTANNIFDYLASEGDVYLNHTKVISTMIDDQEILDEALNYACMTSNLDKFETIKFLIEEGACLCNIDGFNEAIFCGAPIEVLKYLLDNGADISKDDYSALKSANERPDVLNLLMEYEVDNLELDL